MASLGFTPQVREHIELSAQMKGKPLSAQQVPSAQTDSAGVYHWLGRCLIDKYQLRLIAQVASLVDEVDLRSMVRP